MLAREWVSDVTDLLASCYSTDVPTMPGIITLFVRPSQSSHAHEVEDAAVKQKTEAQHNGHCLLLQLKRLLGECGGLSVWPSAEEVQLKKIVTDTEKFISYCNRLLNFPYSELSNDRYSIYEVSTVLNDSTALPCNLIEHHYQKVSGIYGAAKQLEEDVAEFVDSCNTGMLMKAKKGRYAYPFAYVFVGCVE